MKVEFDVDVRALSELRRQAPELFRQATLQTGLAVEREAVMLISRSGEMSAEATGNLKSSIGTRLVKSGGETMAEVFAGAPYAEYVHEGTGIYGHKKQPIRPVNAKALKFSIGGQTLFRRSVKGMKARPFFKVAIERVIPGKMREIWLRVTGKRVIG